MKIIDDELIYEIILSQGKGCLTEKGSMMLYEQCKNTMKVKHGQYNSHEDYEDAFMAGVWYCLRSYKSFDPRRKSIPYFTETFKRGLYWSVNEELQYKQRKNNISLSTIEL